MAKADQSIDPRLLESAKEDLFRAVVADTVAVLPQGVEEKCALRLETLTDEKLIRTWDMDENSILWWYLY